MTNYIILYQPSGGNTGDCKPVAICETEGEVLKWYKENTIPHDKVADWDEDEEVLIDEWEFMTHEMEDK